MRALVFDPSPAGWVACKLLRPLWPDCWSSRLGGLALRQLPPPELPAPDWVLCRTILGGLCGTDLSILRQRQRPDSILQGFSTLPAVLGHENVARVCQVGPGVDRAWLEKRVCVEPTLCCRARGIDPPCLPCREGRFGVCENFSADGLGSSRLPPGTSIGYCGRVGGAWGEFFAAHVSQLIEPPENFSDELAVLTDPVACSLHAVLRADLSGAARVLVYGAGILGLGVVWALRAIGYAGAIDVIARHDHQEQLARSLGASDVLRLPAEKARRFQAVAARVGARVTAARFGNCMLSGGYDATFEAAGSPAGIEEAMKFTRAGGQVVLLATGDGRGSDLTPLWFTELNVIGAYGRAEETFAGQSLTTYRLAHQLMLQTNLRADGLLTHTFPIEHYRRAMLTACDKAASRSVRVAFDFRQPD
jgi:threonine dehydrogenase-like Zn-dependent dehydrogenase